MAVLLWTLVPIVVIHLVLWWRHPPGLRFQLVLDLALAVVVGPAVGRGLDLNPVRCVQSAPPFEAWRWDPEPELQPTQRDLVLQLHPWWAAAREQLLAGHLPWFAPSIGAGAPLASNGQCGLLAPVMLPVWALGPERGSTVMAAWKLEAAGLGTFLLLVVCWRLRWAAAALGGLGFGLSPFVVGWLLSPLAWSLVAMPWVWWLLHGVGRRRARWPRVLATAGLLGWFMGAGVNPETAVIVTGSGLLAALVLHPRRWRRVAVVAVLAVAVTVALAWPTLVTISASSKMTAYRAANPNLEPVPRPLRQAALEQLLVPAGLGHPGWGTWSGPYPYAAGAAGVGGALLAVVVLGSLRRRHWRPWLAAMASLAVAAVLAYRLPPLDAVLVRLPPLDRMTLPRFVLLVPWALCLWAALSWDGLSRTAPGWMRRAAVPVGLVVVAWWVTPPGWVPVSSSLAAAAAVGLLAGRARQGLAVAVVGIELALLAVGVNPTAAPADRLPRPAVLDRLVARVEALPGRVVAVGGALPANLATRYGLADLRSFDPVRPWPMARLHRILGAEDPVLPGPLSAAPPRLCGAWSVRHLVAPGGYPMPGWERVDQGDGVDVYENPHWLAPERVVGEAVALPEEAGWAVLAAGPELLGTAAVVPEGTPAVAATETAVEAEWRTPSWLEAEVRCDGPCLLVVARSWTPGWRAAVDGKAASVVRANLAGLGAVVPAGSHRVELRYRPWGLPR